MKILVTGATGHLGTAVIQTLLKKASPDRIAALVRDERKATDLKAQGADVRVGNYRDLASLDQAMQGIERVLLISGGGEDDALQQHYNVVDAAKKAGVKCIAYTGRALKDVSSLTNQLMVRHFQTEDYIKASGLNYMLFRNILYMDVLPLFVGPRVFETGINLPAGEGRASYALRSEMGEAIANVLLEPSCDNRIYTFTGRETYSFTDVAAALTELPAAGKPVTYNAIEPAVLAKQMQEQDVPEMRINMTIGFMTDIKNGQEAQISPDLENALGRKPASLKEGLKMLYKL